MVQFKNLIHNIIKIIKESSSQINKNAMDKKEYMRNLDEQR